MNNLHAVCPKLTNQRPIGHIILQSLTQSVDRLRKMSSGSAVDMGPPLLRGLSLIFFVIQKLTFSLEMVQLVFFGLKLYIFLIAQQDPVIASTCENGPCHKATAIVQNKRQ